MIKNIAPPSPQSNKATYVRERLKEKSGPFLGTGFIPSIFNNMSLLEAQMLFHG